MTCNFCSKQNKNQVTNISCYIHSLDHPCTKHIIVRIHQAHIQAYNIFLVDQSSVLVFSLLFYTFLFNMIKTKTINIFKNENDIISSLKSAKPIKFHSIIVNFIDGIKLYKFSAFERLSNHQKCSC